MNRVILIGRLTVKPEIRISQTGGASCRFTLVVNRKFKNNFGEYESDFIRCVAFNSTAQTIDKYVQKGDLLGVEGRIQTGSYTASDGSKKYTTDVIVDSIDFLQQKRKSQEVIKQEQPSSQTDPFESFGENVAIDDNFLED